MWASPEVKACRAANTAHLRMVRQKELSKMDPSEVLLLAEQGDFHASWFLYLSKRETEASSRRKYFSEQGRKRRLRDIVQQPTPLVRAASAPQSSAPPPLRRAASAPSTLGAASALAARRAGERRAAAASRAAAARAITDSATPAYGSSSSQQYGEEWVALREYARPPAINSKFRLAAETFAYRVDLQTGLEDRRRRNAESARLKPGPKKGLGSSRRLAALAAQAADRTFDSFAQSACRSHFDRVRAGVFPWRPTRSRTAPPNSETEAAFAAFRTKFFETHLPELRRQWKEMKNTIVTSITPLKVAPRVEARFQKDAGSMKASALRPVWHGTPKRNIAGIANKGLCVPGGRSGVPVANGQVYGRGVYTATTPLTPSWYAHDGHMLLAAVVDDSGAPAMGAQSERPAPTESERVKHCGNGYVVVRKDAAIVPLFDVEFEHTGVDTNGRSYVPPDEMELMPNLNHGGSHRMSIADATEAQADYYAFNAGGTTREHVKYVRGVRKKQLGRRRAEARRTKGSAVSAARGPTRAEQIDHDIGRKEGLTKDSAKKERNAARRLARKERRQNARREDRKIAHRQSRKEAAALRFGGARVKAEREAALRERGDAEAKRARRRNRARAHKEKAGTRSRR